MDYNQSIREAVPWIVSNYRYNSEATQRSKEVLHNLVIQFEDKSFAVQRLYLEYYLCQLMNHLDEDEANQFFKTLFPLPLKKPIAGFLSQLVSLAICLNSKQILTACTRYIEEEQVKLTDDEISGLPANLAQTSPIFAAALIDKGIFGGTYGKTSVNSPKILTQWLLTLNETLALNVTYNGNSLIRYALLGPGQEASDLHFYILDAIRKKHLKQLSNQFIIEMATQVNQKRDATLTEKLSQILAVGAQYGICNSVLSSNQMKTKLKSLLPNSLIMCLVADVPKSS